MSTNEIIENVPKILLIDDNPREALNAKTWFEMSLEDVQLDFNIQDPSNFTSVSDYITLIDSLPASALLIDHRLNESSNANYTGLELADLVRDLRPMLPIFILTKYAGDEKLIAKGFSVDDVMDKFTLRVHAKSYTGRLLRAMKRYDDTRSKQSKQMRDLIIESFSRELNENEKKELFRIRAEAGLDTIGREIEQAEKEHQKLNRAEDIVSALKKLIRED